MPRVIGVPARAILSRFQNADEKPDWAWYINRQLEVDQKAAPTYSEMSRQGGMSPCATPTTMDPCTPHFLRLKSISPIMEESSSFPTSSFGSVSEIRSQCSAASQSAATGKIWDLARDQQGSRHVQQLLDDAANDSEFEALALELQDHVGEAAMCPHANHVLRKCISPRAPRAFAMILHEFMSQDPEDIVQLARHRYGCRIIEKMFEVSEASQIDELCNILLEHAKDICMHAFGNYTMQHFLTHGPVRHRRELIQILADEIAEIGANFHAPAVITVALKQGTEEQAAILANALLKVPGLMAQMTRTKHGHAAVKLAMESLNEAEQEIARREFCAAASSRVQPPSKKSKKSGSKGGSAAAKGSPKAGGA